MGVSPMQASENRSNGLMGETPMPRKRVQVVLLKHALRLTRPLRDLFLQIRCDAIDEARRWRHTRMKIFRTYRNRATANVSTSPTVSVIASWASPNIGMVCFPPPTRRVATRLMKPRLESM